MKIGNKEFESFKQVAEEAFSIAEVIGLEEHKGWVKFPNYDGVKIWADGAISAQFSGGGWDDSITIEAEDFDLSALELTEKYRVRREEWQKAKEIQAARERDKTNAANFLRLRELAGQLGFTIDEDAKVIQK